MGQPLPSALRALMLVFGLTWLLSASDAEQSAKTTKASHLAITQLPLSQVLPWQIQTGLRIASLRARVPTVDRVVLVPDETTFLAAIQKWSLRGRWPILIMKIVEIAEANAALAEYASSLAGEPVIITSNG